MAGHDHLGDGSSTLDSQECTLWVLFGDLALIINFDSHFRSLATLNFNFLFNIKISWYWLWFLSQYQYSSNTLYKINFNIKISWYWLGLNNQYQYSSNALFNINFKINISWYWRGFNNQYQYSSKALFNTNINIKKSWYCQIPCQDKKSWYCQDLVKIVSISRYLAHLCWGWRNWPFKVASRWPWPSRWSLVPWTPRQEYGSYHHTAFSTRWT